MYRKNKYKHAITGLLVMAVLAWMPAIHAKRYEPLVVVSDPYIELRTGPGRGYPKFYVAEQGDQVQLIKRKTDWVKIRTVELNRVKEGWVNVSDMSGTLDMAGDPVIVNEEGLEQFSTRRWELGFIGGDLEGAATLTAFASFYLTPRISTQISATQILGNFTDGYMGNVNLTLSPFPEWRVSPFFTLGTGIIHTEPQTTVVQAEDRTDEIVHVGVGTNLYLTQRFVLRVEYKRHTALTSRDDNDEIDEWKAGFSIFF
ncbi:MAG: SH3 domain-containing protein [Pseudomonadales bacterium]|nr:SH3 domain-containing protein [Pseudomonadales bacterium]